MVADTAAPNPSPPNAQVFAEPIVATSNVILTAPPPPTKLSVIVIVSLIACPVPPLVTTTAYEPLESITEQYVQAIKEENYEKNFKQHEDVIAGVTDDDLDMEQIFKDAEKILDDEET